MRLHRINLNSDPTWRISLLDSLQNLLLPHPPSFPPLGILSFDNYKSW